MAGQFQYYHYDPSMAAAVLFIVLFILTTSAHTFQLFRTKTWYLIPLAVGGYFEWIGYIGRAIASQETPDWTEGPFILQTLLLLLAPALFAASIYMGLGRIVLLTEGEHLALIKRRWMTKLFVTGDVISFLLQGAGGGIMAGKTSNSYSIGSKIIVIGLFVQLLSFGFFVVVAAHYERALRRHPTPHTRQAGSPWHRHLVILYATSVLILVRSIFRVVEYIQGNDGYILQHEYFLYIFDAVLMFAVMVVFNVVHPSEIKAWLRGGRYVVHGWKFQELKRDPNAHQMT